MLRPSPQPSRFDRLRLCLRQRLERLLAEEPKPIRVQRLASPRVRSLEPRIVLNASAELAMGQLLITGTQAAETVQLEVDQNGDLLLRDGAGAVIPIANNPQGANNPLAPAAITSKQISITLGDGDDVLRLQAPSGFDLDVDAGDGMDLTTVQFADDTDARTINISSDTIELDPMFPRVDLIGDNVQLTGDVLIGNAATNTQLQLGNGRFDIDGRVILQSDVAIIGDGAEVDFSDAILTSTFEDDRLHVELQNQPSSNFSLRGADASGGSFVDDLSIASANDVTIASSPVTLEGDLTLRNVTGETQIDSNVVASSVSIVTTRDIQIEGSIETNDGQILVSTSSALTVSGSLNTSLANTIGAVNLNAQGIELSETAITTQGGLINIRGPVQISDSVLIDSGNEGIADSGGRVQFFDSIESEDNNGDSLRITTLGQSLDGAVRLQGPAGLNSNLNGLKVDAGQIEVNSIRVRNGNIQLTAQDIRLIGDELRALERGDIVIAGDFSLPVGNTTIESADQVRFMGQVKGQAGTGDLFVSAGADALFDRELNLVQNLTVQAAQLAQFDGEVLISENLNVDANTIRIRANARTDVGNVQLNSRDLTSIERGSTLEANAGRVLIDGGGGRVDFSAGTIRTNNTGDAVTIVDANQVLLGNLIASSGNVTIGVSEDISGPILQASGTTVMIDRLNVNSASSVDLSNDGNDIRSIERILASGPITIQDSIDDLTVAAVNSRANSVDIAANGSIGLRERAVTAESATVNVTATNSIFDIDDTPQANITAGTVTLSAGRPGIGSSINAVDIVATVALNANTDDGDVSLANSAGPMLVGVIDAGIGNLTLAAVTIDDASVDQETDLTVRQANLFATEGIGSNAPLELFSVQQLDAVTGTGGIELDLTANSNTLVDRLTADTGDVVVRHRGVSGTQPIELRFVEAGNGAISVDAEGTITATRVVSLNVNGSDDMNAAGGTDSRDVTLVATGVQSDILVNSIDASEGADVFLTADDDILELGTDDSARVIADDLKLIAGNNTPDQPSAILLTTRVADLQADVQGPNRGDLKIAEMGSVNLASSDAASDEEVLQTSNGQIIVSAANVITVVDALTKEDGGALNQDVEILARGSEGRIDFRAQSIELTDQAQLHAEKTTTAIIPPTRPMPVDPLLGLTPEDRSIYIEASEIVFGQNIEINTGESQGVARIFAPRPPDAQAVDPGSDTPVRLIPERETFAFFDPGSVSTNVLEQALVNDATGTLTLDIGRSGERGLTIDIDWGDLATDADRAEGTPDPNTKSRFQQINGLSADAPVFVGVDREGTPIDPVLATGAPVLQIEHFYSENDILETRENGRESGTGPIEVRFAVRHHESILVLGDTISQRADGELLPPQNANGVVSSTDNIQTARELPSGLENGRTAFVIPALSIPVAFFPTREVIPVIETPEFAVRQETAISLTTSTVETVESTITSVASRKEYFQIRVLSPDPDGLDLAAPQKLPDDVLSGDKIQQLFAGLPDGRYEIEYVLGDGNEQSILRVDVRDGEATIPDEELDEGLLKLKRIKGGLDPMDSTKDDFNPNDVAPEPLPTPVSIVPDRPTDERPDSTSNDQAALPIATGVLLMSRHRRLKELANSKRLSIASRFSRRRSERSSHLERLE
ncbi:MAG: beta strand repeat-containing protein [Rubripirellula sp.]